MQSQKQQQEVNGSQAQYIYIENSQEYPQPQNNFPSPNWLDINFVGGGEEQKHKDGRSMRKQRSRIWKFFVYDNEQSSFCKKCQRRYRWKPGSSLSKMKQHISKYHPESDLDGAAANKNNINQFHKLNNQNLLGYPLHYNTEIKIDDFEKDNMMNVHNEKNQKNQNGSIENILFKNPQKITKIPKSGKSKIWNIMHKINDQNAYCILCEQLIPHHDKKNRKLWRHVQNQHPQYIVDQQGGYIYRSVLSKQQKQSTQKDKIYLEQENKIKKKKETDDIYKLLDIQQMNRNILDIKKQFGVNIIRIDSQENYKSGFLMISSIMRKNFMKYKSSIVLWYSNCPTQSKDFDAVVYIISQDLSLNPILLGLLILIQSTKQNIQNGFLAILKAMQLNCPIQEQKLVILTPNQIKKILIETTSNIYKNAIYLPKEVKKTNQSEVKKILGEIVLTEIVQRNQNMTEEKKTKYQSFLGFSLCFSFIQNLKRLLNQNLAQRDCLTDFLVDCLKYQNASELQKQRNMEQSINHKNALNYKFITFQGFISCSELSKIRDNVSAQIFMKLCYTFLYGCFYMISQKISKSKFCLREERKSHIFKSNTKKWYVTYSMDDKKWLCSCGLIEAVGLPCPHLARILTIQQKTIAPYIHKRWISKPIKPTNPLNNKALLKMMKNSNQNMFENTLLRLNEQSFLEQYWS